MSPHLRLARLPAVLTALLLCVVVAGVTAAQAAAPTVTTGPSSAVGAGSATLAGTVNPGGVATTHAFDYGTSVAYGSSTTTQNAGAGSTAIDVASTVTGLLPGTTYHYRLVASNADGTDAGADRTFTTAPAPAKPSVSSQAATAVSATSATVGASVDPNGQATSVVFDYGTSTAYGSTTSAQSAGAGTDAVTIKATLNTLAGNTTYHYRARATNATGSTNGGDRTFKTGSLAKASLSSVGVTDISAVAATVTARVDPNGRATSVVAQIGQTAAYGSETPAVAAGSGSSNVSVRLPVGALQPLRTYHYRVVATSDAGTVTSRDRTFRTAAIPNGLTLSLNPARVVFGQAATLNVLLSGSRNGGVGVNLFATPYPFTQPYLAFAPGLRTDGAGSASTRVLPRRSTRYRGEAVVSGLTVKSRTLRVTVVPNVTVRIANRPGRRIAFTGVVRPRGNGTVSLRRVLPDGRAVTVKRARVRRVPGAFFGRYTVVVPRRTARYLVHVKPDTRGMAAGDSPIVGVER